MAKNTIIEDLIMVQLHIEYDTGYRPSKEMEEMIATNTGADKRALRTGVMVFDKNHISPFTAQVSTLRKYYLDQSLPWEKGNWRVVPVSAWQDFKDELEGMITKLKDRFDEVFMKGFPTITANFSAQVGNLSIPCPSQTDLREKFSVSYKMGQVASYEDIRIKGIDNVVKKRVSDDMKQRYEDQIGDGLNELAKKLVTAAQDIGERVSDGDQKGKKYTRSLENLKELANTAEKLNITGNDAIKEACKTIRDDIAQWSPEAIKTTPMVREHVAGAAGSITDKLANLSL